MIVHPKELGLAMVDIVLSVSKIEIEDIDGDDLDDFIVAFGFGEMFRDSLCRGKQNTLEVIEFPFVLDFDEDNFVLLVPDLHVYPVGFVLGGLPIAFAFQDLENRDVFLQEFR